MCITLRWNLWCISEINSMIDSIFVLYSYRQNMVLNGFLLLKKIKICNKFWQKCLLLIIFITSVMLFSKLLYDCHTAGMTWQWKSTFESIRTCKKRKLITNFHCYAISVIRQSHTNVLNSISLIIVWFSALYNATNHNILLGSFLKFSSHVTAIGYLGSTILKTLLRL